MILLIRFFPSFYLVIPPCVECRCCVYFFFFKKKMVYMVKHNSIKIVPGYIPKIQKESLTFYMKLQYTVTGFQHHLLNPFYILTGDQNYIVRFFPFTPEQAVPACLLKHPPFLSLQRHHHIHVGWYYDPCDLQCYLWSCSTT